ncbi:MAG: hypothetical protein H0M93_04790, partial [Methanophagales archaeon]|nr:hypothetical protein [Methanophagales archaeon]
MKWNLFNKKITAIFSVAIFFAVLMITSTFAGFITPVMAADEELELANIAKSANENTTLQLPRIIGSVDTPGHALDVFISGNHAFVAD